MRTAFFKIISYFSAAICLSSVLSGCSLFSSDSQPAISTPVPTIDPTIAIIEEKLNPETIIASDPMVEYKDSMIYVSEPFEILEDINPDDYTDLVFFSNDTDDENQKSYLFIGYVSEESDISAVLFSTMSALSKLTENSEYSMSSSTCNRSIIIAATPNSSEIVNRFSVLCRENTYETCLDLYDALAITETVIEPEETEVPTEDDSVDIVSNETKITENSDDNSEESSAEESEQEENSEEIVDNSELVE